MAKDILVTIVCNDIYSRNWMSLLLVRDWRTRVISELSLRDDLQKALKQMLPSPDMLLIDLDANQETPELSSKINALAGGKLQPKVVLISSQPEAKILRRLDLNLLNGYLLKGEISTSFGWALTFASEGRFVLTSQAMRLFDQSNIVIPKDNMVLKGTELPRPYRSSRRKSLA